MEADNVEEARERVMEGNFDTVGDSWDASDESDGDFETELVPDEPDED